MSAAIHLPKVKSSISLREEFDDWALLFNPDTGKAVGLTPTGLTIWKGLMNRDTLSTIIRTLGEEYDGVPADLDNDIRSFLDEIVRLGYAEPQGKE